MDSKEISRKTAQATRWSTFTELAAKLISPITNMILARLLVPEMFGVVATVTMVVSFSDIFTDAGFQKYLIQHDFADRKQLDKSTNVAFWTNFAISVLLWVIIFAFSEPLAALVGNPGKGMAITIAALSLPLTSFSSIQMARFKRDFDFKTLFYIRILTAFVPLLVTVPLALVLRNYWALIIGTLAGNAVNAAVLTWRSDWKPRLSFSFSLLKEMFSYSWWILLESVSTWLTSYIGTFVVGVYLSQYYLGLYKTTMSTANQVIGLITAATSAPLFVALSKLKNQKEKLLDTYYDYIGSLSFLLIPLGVGIFLYRDLVTGVLLGDQWMEGSSFLGLWGLTGSVCLLFGTYCNGLYNAVGKTYLSFWTQVMHLVVLVPVLLWAAPKGFIVLCVARCLVRLELVLVQQLTMKIIMKASLRKQLKNMLPATVATAVMCLVAIALRFVGNSLLWQAVGVAACIVAYFAVCIVFFKKQLLEALSVLGFAKGRENG